MENIRNYSKAQLLVLKEELEKQYAAYQAQHLKLDMSRGKPAGTQLDLTNGILLALTKYTTEDGESPEQWGLVIN